MPKPRAWLKLLRNDRGAFAIEFALCLPVLMTLILVGLELTKFVLANQRVRQIAAMTADNASRLRRMTKPWNSFRRRAEKAAAAIQFQTKPRGYQLGEKQCRGERQWIRWQRLRTAEPIRNTERKARFCGPRCRR